MKHLLAQDAKDLFEVRGDPETMAFWDWPADANPADTALVVEQLLSAAASGETIFWTVRLRTGQDFVGLCDLSEIRALESADIGFVFARRFWGLGLAHEALVCVIEQARILGLKSLYARIHSANQRSERLLQRAGFRLVEMMPSLEIRPGVRRDCKRFELRLEIPPQCGYDRNRPR
jgi:ribosomal-protein-alanine N-acetyltransferase